MLTPLPVIAAKHSFPTLVPGALLITTSGDLTELIPGILRLQASTVRATNTPPSQAEGGLVRASPMSTRPHSSTLNPKTLHRMVEQMEPGGHSGAGDPPNIAYVVARLDVFETRSGEQHASVMSLLQDFLQTLQRAPEAVALERGFSAARPARAPKVSVVSGSGGHDEATVRPLVFPIAYVYRGIPSPSNVSLLLLPNPSIATLLLIPSPSILKLRPRSLISNPGILNSHQQAPSSAFGGALGAGAFGALGGRTFGAVAPAAPTAFGAPAPAAAGGFGGSGQAAAAPAFGAGAAFGGAPAATVRAIQPPLHTPPRDLLFPRPVDNRSGSRMMLVCGGSHSEAVARSEAARSSPPPSLAPPRLPSARCPPSLPTSQLRRALPCQGRRASPPRAQQPTQPSLACHR